MGKGMFGIPKAIALELKRKYDLRYFVETGTFKGSTAMWAASQFERVWSIEDHLRTFNDNLARNGLPRNVNWVYGSSRSVLPEALAAVPGRALIWLNSHWTKDGNGRRKDCAIIEELEALNSCGLSHVVMIDDAHYWRGDLAAGSADEWRPTLMEMEPLLQRWSWRVREDVVVCELIKGNSEL